MSGKPFNVFIGQAQAETVTSDWMKIDHERLLAIQADYGAITGTLTVEGRIFGMEPMVVEELAFDALAGVAGSQRVQAEVGFDQFRVKYVHTSGSGGLRVGAHAKGG